MSRKGNHIGCLRKGGGIFGNSGNDLGAADAFERNELSLPEMILLRRVLKPPLIATFIGVTGLGIIAVGYLFNAVIPS